MFARNHNFILRAFIFQEAVAFRKAYRLQRYMECYHQLYPSLKEIYHTKIC